MRRRWQQRLFVPGRLHLVLLLLVAALSGYGLTNLYFSHLQPAQYQSQAAGSRWRRFGAPFTGDGLALRERLGLGRRSDSAGSLLSSASGDGNVKQLMDGLHALRISCHLHPPNQRRALGEKYAKFLEVLAIYTAFHAHERRREGARRLVWICDAHRACGGLADRIKGVTYALLLAVLSRRVLLLDWRDRQFGEQTYLEPHLLNWNLTQEERKRAYPRQEYESYYEQEHNPEGDLVGKSPPGDSVAFVHIFSTLGGIGVDLTPESLKTNLEAIEGRSTWVILESNMEPCSLVNKTQTASQQWIEQGVAALGLDKLSPYDIDSLVGVVFRYLFQFSAEILREVSAAREVLGLRDAAYVGVHVRTGFAGSVQQESVKHPKLYRSALQWESTLSCAYRHAVEQLGDRALLFLATDSSLVKNRTLDVRRYGGRLRCLDNPVVHLDRLEGSPHQAGEFEREGVLSAWVELVLLAESQSIVMGESGFAFLAHSLCFTQTVDGLTCKPLE